MDNLSLKEEKSRQSGTLVCRNVMEVSGEKHVLDYGVNVFLSSAWDKFPLGNGTYQLYLQGMKVLGL